MMISVTERIPEKLCTKKERKTRSVCAFVIYICEINYTTDTYIMSYILQHSVSLDYFVN